MTRPDATFDQHGVCMPCRYVAEFDRIDWAAPCRELDAITQWGRDSNKQPFTWPLGMSAEAFSARAIEWCDCNLESAQDRELVASWIIKHPQQFKAASVTTTAHYTVGDLLLDSKDDYRAMALMFDALYRPGQAFGLAEISVWMSRQLA